MIVEVRLLAVALLGLVTGCTDQWTVAEFVGGKGNERTLARAETVRVWRVAEASPREGSNISQKTDPKNWHSRYGSVGDGVTLDRAQRERLQTLLLATASYTRGRHPKGTDFASNMCLFDPFVRMRFDAGRESAEVWVCFLCSEVAFFDGARFTEPEDAHPIASELLALAKSVLKDDSVITKIPQR